jgi:hypothetical protein
MRGLWKVFAAVSGLVVSALLVAAGVLFASGAVSGARLQQAARVLRDGPAPSARPAVEPPPSADDAARRQAAEALARKDEDLRRLDGRVAARQAQVDAERLRLAEEAARLKADREKLDRERQATVQAKNDADLTANVPILSKMDGASIVTVLRGWDNATFVRYLRALRPGKAAEVIDALQSDPTFEQEFRRPPAGSPRGSRTRAELLMEEFKKAPQG